MLQQDKKIGINSPSAYIPCTGGNGYAEEKTMPFYDGKLFGDLISIKIPYQSLKGKKLFRPIFYFLPFHGTFLFGSYVEDGQGMLITEAHINDDFSNIS